MVVDKLYKVTDINFSDLTLEANECDLLISDVADGEVFNVEDFKEFHIKLHNWTGKVIDFAEFNKNRKGKS